MRKTIYNIIMCGSLLTIAGCSSDTDSTFNNSDAGKQPIELSVGVESPVTRAVVTNGTDKTLEALPVGTGLWMVMKSEYASLSDANLDYKGSQTAKYCVTVGTTGTPANETPTLNPVTFADGKTRYWDDAHGRSSNISVWALAVPGVNNETFNKSTKDFSTTTEGLTVDWTIPTAQTAATVKSKDLCFSNNVVGSNAMKFNASDNPKFAQGNLIFYHALTKITVILKEGNGFSSETTDFNLAESGVTLKGFNLNGTFNVADGEFTSTTSMTATTMACGTKTAEGYTLEALVMPGTGLGGSLKDAASFSIDGDPFAVDAATLKDKLPSGFDKFEAGKNYVFTFIINKTGIEVTATIADWQSVNATEFAPKINIDKCYGQETNSNNFGKAFSLYLSESQASEYQKKADVSATYALTPQLYWPNHQTHYFFRGIYPEVKAEGTPSEKVSGSAITVANSAYSEGSYPSDLMLGYPRKDDGSADETCKVHTSPVTQGICADEHNIHMNFQYVMSQVEVQLTTSTGDDKVVLDGNTTIGIIGGYKSGSIALANGVATGSTKADYKMLGVKSNGYDCLDAIIPQSLTGLIFRITVQDADGYKDSYDATIADIKVDGKTIGAWAPGKKYIYHLYITKTAMKLTATLKDWETVTSGENHIWM